MSAEHDHVRTEQVDRGKLVVSVMRSSFSACR